MMELNVYTLFKCFITINYLISNQIKLKYHQNILMCRHKDRLTEFFMGRQDSEIAQFLHNALDGNIPEVRTGISMPNIIDNYGESGRVRQTGLGPHKNYEHSFFVNKNEDGVIRVTDESIIKLDGK